MARVAARLGLGNDRNREQPTSSGKKVQAGVVPPPPDPVTAGESAEELGEAATQLAAAGELDQAEKVAVIASDTGDASALVDVALRFFLAGQRTRAHEVWSRAAESTTLPALEKVTTEGQVELSEPEIMILNAWLQADSRAAAAHKLGISSPTVRIHLLRIRTKYAAAGRPARTKAALTARAVEDGILQPPQPRTDAPAAPNLPRQP
jgi:DNA-binding NarL/FixJ family response regulator